MTSFPRVYLAVAAGLALTACAASRATIPLSAGRSDLNRDATPIVTTAVDQIAPGLVVQRVAADTWIVTHIDLYESNVAVARMPDGTVVFCSSPFDSQTTRALISWARSHLQPTRMLAINTHWHLDGSGGNEAFHQAGVVTYASTQTSRLLLEMGLRHRDTAAAGLPAQHAANVRATAIVDAKVKFDPAQGLTLAYGGEPIIIAYPGAAHTADNVVVYFPWRRVLFGGCALKVGDHLGYLGDASLSTWRAALSVISNYDATVVVPGHGPVGGREIIANTQRLVDSATSVAH